MTLNWASLKPESIVNDGLPRRFGVGPAAGNIALNVACFILGLIFARSPGGTGLLPKRATVTLFPLGCVLALTAAPVLGLLSLPQAATTTHAAHSALGHNGKCLIATELKRTAARRGRSTRFWVARLRIWRIEQLERLRICRGCAADVAGVAVRCG